MNEWMIVLPMDAFNSHKNVYPLLPSIMHPGVMICGLGMSEWAFMILWY